MKKILALSGALLIGAFSFSNISTMEVEQTIETAQCNYGRCGAIKKDGYQCKNCSQEGSYYCWSHRY